MLAHYLRRILGGLLTLFLASFLFYNLLLQLIYSMFAVMPDQPDPRRLDPEAALYFNAIIEHYEVNQPWPSNYTNWLFDPTEPDKPYYFVYVRHIVEYMPPYVDVQAGPLNLRGSGLFTGDLGMSSGVPVFDLAVQSNTLLLTAILFGAITLLMAVSVVQRKGREPVLGAASVPLAAVARIEATYRYARAAT